MSKKRNSSLVMPRSLKSTFVNIKNPETTLNS